MIKKLIKKIIEVLLILYSYNSICPSKAIIPINIITILSISIFGPLALLILIIIKIIIF